MFNEIEEEIKKNLIIHLSCRSCKYCFKPYSHNSIIELDDLTDDLTYIFAEKMFYKLDCSVANNINTIRKNYKYYTENNARVSFSLLKPLLHGNIMRFGITCVNCWETKYIEYNLDKFNGAKNYLK